MSGTSFLISHVTLYVFFSHLIIAEKDLEGGPSILLLKSTQCDVIENKGNLILRFINEYSYFKI